jgi:hypothetical protein
LHTQLIDPNDLKNELVAQHNEIVGGSFPDLDTCCPFESIFGKGIYSPHKLLVEVIEAKSLLPSIEGKYEDVYCKLSLKKTTQQFKILTSFGRKMMTSVCDKTLDPVWYNEKFVFDLPPSAKANCHDYALHIVVRGKNLLGSTIIGETTVKLSYFDNREEREGWFSLQLKSLSTTGSLIDPLKAGGKSFSSGSIKLKVNWVQSDQEFNNYFIKALNRFF